MSYLTPHHDRVGREYDRNNEETRLDDADHIEYEITARLEIRRYRESDLDSVWALLHLAEGTLTPDRVPPIDPGDPANRDILHIDDAYLRCGGEFIVGLRDGHIVAMGGIQRTAPDRAVVLRVRVHHDYQRRGYGRAIMRALEDRAAALGYTTLHLDTTVTRVPAQRLYQSLGYREVGRMTPSPDWECILFEKDITGS